MMLLLCSRSVMSDSLQPHGLQHARLPCPSPSPGVCLNSCPSSRWCHPTILSSVVPLSSCLQSCPALGPFLMSQLFACGQSIGASASVLPVNIQDWFPLGLTGLISLLSKRLSRIFSRTTVWRDKKKKKWWEHVKNTPEPIWRSSRWQIITDLSKKWLTVMGYNP